MLNTTSINVVVDYNDQCTNVLAPSTSFIYNDPNAIKPDSLEYALYRLFGMAHDCDDRTTFYLIMGDKLYVRNCRCNTWHRFLYLVDEELKHDKSKNVFYWYRDDHNKLTRDDFEAEVTATIEIQASILENTEGLTQDEALKQVFERVSFVIEGDGSSDLPWYEDN